MKKGILESHSLWFKYKSKVWPQETEQTYSVHNIMKTMRSIRNQSELAYLSSPLTFGKVLYDEISKTLMSPESRYFITGTASYDEKCREVPMFKEIMENVIKTNYNKGYDFLNELEERLDIPILFPLDLYPRGDGWSQDDFQALWLTLIGEKCSELHMNRDWEFSNGASEEFAHAYQLKLGIPKGSFGKDFSPFYNTKEGENESRERMRNIQVYDHEGKPLAIEDGLAAIDDAIPWIKGARFNTERLENTRNILEWTHEMIGKGFYQ